MCQSGSRSRYFWTIFAAGESGSDSVGLQHHDPRHDRDGLLAVGLRRQQPGQCLECGLRVELHEECLLGQQGVQVGLGELGQVGLVLADFVGDHERAAVDGAALLHHGDQHPGDRLGEAAPLELAPQGGELRLRLLLGRLLGLDLQRRRGREEGPEAHRAVGELDHLLDPVIAQVAIVVQGGDDLLRGGVLELQEGVVLGGRMPVLPHLLGDHRQHRERRIEVREQVLPDPQWVQPREELRRGLARQGTHDRAVQRFVKPLVDLGNLVDGAEQRLPAAAVGVEARMSSTVRVSKRTVYVSRSMSRGSACLGRCSMTISYRPGGRSSSMSITLISSRCSFFATRPPTKMLRCPTSSASKYTITRPRATIRSSWP